MNRTSHPSPLFERANVLSYVQVTRERGRTWIKDPASGRPIDINTPIVEVPPSRVAALHRAANRYVSNEKFRVSGRNVADGVIASVTGDIISVAKLERIDNEDLCFIDVISRDFPVEDPVSWGGPSAPTVDAPVNNDTPTPSDVEEMNTSDVHMYDSDAGKVLFNLIFLFTSY